MAGNAEVILQAGARYWVAINGEQSRSLSTSRLVGSNLSRAPQRLSTKDFVPDVAILGWRHQGTTPPVSKKPPVGALSGARACRNASAAPSSSVWVPLLPFRSVVSGSVHSKGTLSLMIHIWSEFP